MPLGQLGLIWPSGLPTDPPSLGWGRLGPCRGAVLALGGPARSGQALAVVSGLRGATCGGPLAGWHLTAPSPARCATASPGPHMGPRSPASAYLPRGPQGLLQAGGALGVQGRKERREVRPGAHCMPLEGGARRVAGQRVGGWLGPGYWTPLTFLLGLFCSGNHREQEGERE